jgi:hypothetical protein
MIYDCALPGRGCGPLRDWHWGGLKLAPHLCLLLASSSHKGNWMAVDPKKSISIDAGQQRHFVERVALEIEKAGFNARPEFNRTFDLSFIAANGDRIAVECGLCSHVFGSEKQFEAWLGQIRRVQQPPIKETLVVSTSFPTKVIDLLDRYHGVEMVYYSKLHERLEHYKRPKPKPKSKTTRIASTIQSKKSEITTLTEALAIQIDTKLASLKDQHPNDPDSITAIQSQISDYEALRAQVAALQQAITELSKSTRSKTQVAQAATSFGDGVKAWWNKQHVNIVDRSVEMGVVLSAVGVCSLLGVSPNIAMAAATALVGGKSVAKALKGVIKVST